MLNKTWSHFDRKYSSDYKSWVQEINKQGYIPITDTEKTYAVKREDYQSERTKINIRVRREKECFKYCDRPLWLTTLTEDQFEEMVAWRQAWLDAPKTLVIPEKPSWI